MYSQYSQQYSVPDLFVYALAFLALRKMFFPSVKNTFPPKKKIPFFYATFQFGSYNVFKKKFYAHKKLKKSHSKVAHNWP